MSKILDSEFRKVLYKNLIEAGYEKHEAQKIVCDKYYTTLSEEVKGTLTMLVETINNGDYDKGLDFDGLCKDVGEKMGELRNLRKIVAP